MGLLHNFNLSEHIQERTVFVETGTANGESLSYAAGYAFKNLYSIEIDIECAKNAVKRFEDDKRIEILCGSSCNMLSSVINKHDGPMLFWLDAHFPGETHGTAYNHEQNIDLRLPLESELVIIKSLKDTSRDYFIIDDLRIYEDGPFLGGIWSDRKTMGGNGIDFIYRLFQDTHEIIRDYRDQGYIILKPK